MKEKPILETTVKQLAQLYEDYHLREILNIKAELDFMVYSEISKIDSSMITLDTEGQACLGQELTALNIELFGLAWVNYNYRLFEEGKQDSFKCDYSLCSEILFTKSLSGRPKRDEDWNAAGFYNRAILEAAIAQSNSVNWSTFRDMPDYYERARAVRSSSPDKSIEVSAQSFREHYDKILREDWGKLIVGLDYKDCSLRLSNRLASIQSWRDGIMIPQRLSSAFAERLGITPTTEVTLLFQRLVMGLYNNARNYINAVIDYGSWELARKATIDLRQSLLEVGRKLLEKQKGTI